MKIKSIAPWFGGKRKLAPEIVRQLGPHTSYFEPFCGSMAVLFEKPPSRAETVCDLHGDLVNLARVVQRPDESARLHDLLDRTLFCDGLLWDAEEVFRLQPVIEEPEGITRAVDRIQRAYWFFLVSWMGRNGVSGTKRLDYQLAVRWTSGGGSPTIRWRNAIDSLSAWHRRLTNVVILCRDGFTVLERAADEPTTVLYVDPPYHLASRGQQADGKKEVKRSARYLHDWNNDEQHERLAGLLRRFQKARVVLSYYDDPLIRRLYEGWSFIEHTRAKNLAGANQRDRRRDSVAPELLIINRDPVEAS